MKNVLSLIATLAIAVSTCTVVFAQEGDASAPAKPKHTIKDVMKKAMKGGLLKKVASGKATDKEKMELLDLMVSMTENKPPKGDMASWNKFSANVAIAAAAAAVGRENAADTLKAATNCKACHTAHKPPAN